PAPEPEPEPEPIDEVNLTINLEDLDISTKDLLSTHLHLSNFTKPFIRISKITGKIKQYKTMKEGTIFIKSSKVLTETTNLITNLALYRWNLRNKDGSITAFYPQTENAIEDPKVLLYNETWDYWDKENFDEIYSAHLRIKPTLVPKPLTFNQRIKQALILGHNVKLEGTAGCGKTTLSRQMAKELNLDIYKITLTRQTTMKDLVGYYNPILGKEVSSPIIEAYTKGGLLFIDEMDAGDPNTLIIVNSVCDRELAHHTTGKLIECHPDFKIISAINLTDELHHYVGKNKLDKSTNSRYKNFKLDTWQDRFTPNVISVYNKVNDFAVQLGKEAYWCDIRGLDRFVLDVPVLDIKVALQDLTAGLNLPKEQLYILISLYNEV
ncbi:MAG: AAA family ATPase, partial [Bacteroidales bacterium]|nr:AAA family ATPase [Bacteroidales bacterium]